MCHPERVKRSFVGLRLIGVVIGVVVVVGDVAALGSLVTTVAAGGSWSAPWWAVPLAVVLHLLVVFAWSYRFVREPGLTYNALGRRRLARLADEDVVALRRSENTFQVVGRDGVGPSVSTGFGVRLDDVVACYADLIATRPELIADQPELRAAYDRTHGRSEPR